MGKHQIVLSLTPQKWRETATGRVISSILLIFHDSYNHSSKDSHLLFGSFHINWYKRHLWQGTYPGPPGLAAPAPLSPCRDQTRECLHIPCGCPGWGKLDIRLRALHLHSKSFNSISWSKFYGNSSFLCSVISSQHFFAHHAPLLPDSCSNMTRVLQMLWALCYSFPVVWILPSTCPNLTHQGGFITLKRHIFMKYSPTASRWASGNYTFFFFLK